MSSINSLNDFSEQVKPWLRSLLEHCYKVDFVEMHVDVDHAESITSELVESITSDLVALGFMKATRNKSVYKFMKLREIKAWLKAEGAPPPKKCVGLSPAEADEIFAATVASITPPMPSHVHATAEGLTTAAADIATVFAAKARAEDAPSSRFGPFATYEDAERAAIEDTKPAAPPLAAFKWLHDTRLQFTNARLDGPVLLLANNDLALQVPFPILFDAADTPVATPDCARFLRALRAFERANDVDFCNLENGNLVIKGDNASVTVPCADKPLFRTGVAATMPFPASLREAFEVLAEFCEPSSAQPFRGAVQLHGSLATVCTGHTVVQAWVEDMDVVQPIVVPLSAVQIVCAIPAAPESFGTDGRMLTVRYADGTVLTVALYTSQFPSVDQVWPCAEVTQAMHESKRPINVIELFDALKMLGRLEAGIERVCVDHGRIYANDAHVNVASLLGTDRLFIGKDSFERLLEVASRITFTDRSCYFENETVRGVTYCAHV